jgi:GNAT superfamily N-acetyltransferase
MARIRCRQADRSDIAAMARIRAEGGWEGGAPEDRMAAYLEGRHHPRHALAPRVLYVAEEADSLVGYIAGHLTRRYGCDGEREWISVVPERRRTGVATKLLRLLAVWFARQKAARICVDVDPANTVARLFYARHGAVELKKFWLVWEDIRVVPGNRSRKISRRGRRTNRGLLAPRSSGL